MNIAEKVAALVAMSDANHTQVQVVTIHRTRAEEQAGVNDPQVWDYTELLEISEALEGDKT